MKKNEDIYEELPLFMIEQQYGGTPAGLKLGLDSNCLAPFVQYDSFQSEFMLVSSYCFAQPRAFIELIKASLQPRLNIQLLECLASFPSS